MGDRGNPEKPREEMENVRNGPENLCTDVEAWREK
jgi:hypothetical protein